MTTPPTSTRISALLLSHTATLARVAVYHGSEHIGTALADEADGEWQIDTDGTSNIASGLYDRDDLALDELLDIGDGFAFIDVDDAILDLVYDALEGAPSPRG